MKRMLRRGGLTAMLLLGLAAEPAQAQQDLVPAPELVPSPQLAPPLQPVRPPGLNQEFHRAEAAWKSGTSPLEAKARVDRVLEELPHDTEALKLRAQVLLSMSRPEAALADIQHAIDLGARDGEAYFILCEAARLSGKSALARHALDAASDLVFDDAALHVQLSWNAVALDQLNQAEAFARVARALDPHDPMAHYQLARVFVLKDRLDDAAAVLAGGLEAAVVDPMVVVQDSVLRRLADHEALRPFAR